MDHWITGSAHVVSNLAELFAVAVLAAGLVTAVVSGLKRWRSGEVKVFASVRGRLGRSLLLGLEFLIVADVLATISVRMTFESVGVLAIFVGIRTFLSFALHAELEGRWPWQAHATGDTTNQRG